MQISFAWLFALLVGAVILFLAIFLSTKLIKTEQTIQDAKTGKEIGVLLNPLETGFESGKTNSLSFPTETRIYNLCNTNGEFGRQIIKVSQKNFNQWSETNINPGFSNKYIFSEGYTEGEKFYVFSKPFFMPFKVSDLIIITSSEEEYCFLNSPGEIEEELLFLNQPNLLVGNCSKNAIKVCFSGSCDIKVNLATKQVFKNNGTIDFYGGALMYAAIFSEEEVYECQIKRLMKRLNSLANLYGGKSKFVLKKDCDSNLNLLSLATIAEGLESSKELKVISMISEEVGRENNLASCKLW